jgi:hypothetical protein
LERYNHSDTFTAGRSTSEVPDKEEFVTKEEFVISWTSISKRNRLKRNLKCQKTYSS